MWYFSMVCHLGLCNIYFLICFAKIIDQLEMAPLVKQILRRYHCFVLYTLPHLDKPRLIDYILTIGIHGNAYNKKPWPCLNSILIGCFIQSLHQRVI